MDRLLTVKMAKRAKRKTNPESQTPVSCQKVLRNLARLRPARRRSATRACRTALALRLRCGGLMECFRRAGHDHCAAVLGLGMLVGCAQKEATAPVMVMAFDVITGWSESVKKDCGFSVAASD